MEKGVIIKDISTNSSTLNELEEYFGVGQTVSVKIDEEENH
jgi:ABC-2 type transport system ATP-binding protein